MGCPALSYYPRQEGLEKSSVYFLGGLEKKASRRKICFNSYTYGFNGKEKDDKGEFGSSTHYDYGFRIYNPGIAKFLSVDPLTKSYPMLTPYQFASNRPIDGIDLDGLEYLNYSAITFKKIRIESPTYKNIETTVQGTVEGKILKDKYANLSFGLMTNGLYLGRNATESNFDEVVISHKGKVEVKYGVKSYRIDEEGRRKADENTHFKSYKNKQFVPDLYE